MADPNPDLGRASVIDAVLEITRTNREIAAANHTTAVALVELIEHIRETAERLPGETRVMH